MKMKFFASLALWVACCSQILAIKTEVEQAARRAVEEVRAAPPGAPPAHEAACGTAKESLDGARGSCASVVAAVDEIHALVDGADNYHSRVGVGAARALADGREKPLKEKLTVFHTMVAKTLADLIWKHFLTQLGSDAANSYKVKKIDVVRAGRGTRRVPSFRAAIDVAAVGGWRGLLRQLRDADRLSLGANHQKAEAEKIYLVSGLTALSILSILVPGDAPNLAADIATAPADPADPAGPVPAVLVTAIQKRLWVMDAAKLLYIWAECLKLKYAAGAYAALNIDAVFDKVAVDNYDKDGYTIEPANLANARDVLNKMFGHP